MAQSTYSVLYNQQYMSVQRISGLREPLIVRARLSLHVCSTRYIRHIALLLYIQYSIHVHVLHVCTKGYLGSALRATHRSCSTVYLPWSVPVQPLGEICCADLPSIRGALQLLKVLQCLSYGDMYSVTSPNLAHLHEMYSLACTSTYHIQLQHTCRGACLFT